MILKIAIAKDGFIDVNDNPAVSNVMTFLACLQKIFTFVDKDLQEFDGNTCKMINAHNPTNSIFIYTNQQGTFLYQITSATPYIHKNNMIWNCQTFKMEDVATINDVLSRNTFVDMKRNKRFTKSYYSETLSSNNLPLAYAGDLTKIIKVKDNFENMALNSVNITDSISTVINSIWTTRKPTFTLKIKCLVDPTGNGLTTKASDGSFNFFFPIVIADSNNVGDRLPYLTDKLIIYNWNGNTILQSAFSVADVISKYSENIKSIEVLPFDISGMEFVTGTKYETFEVGGGFYYSGGYVGAKITGQCVATDVGIFSPVGETFSTPVKIDYANDEIDLTFGGGAKGFVRTPLGNVEIDFNTYTQNDATDTDTANPNTRKGFWITLKTEGWHIGGLGKAEIPPHYINFYTDNAGQVFIQNLTTNAQELRQLERDVASKQEENKQNYVLGEVKHYETANVLDVINPLAWVGHAQQSLASATQYEFDKAKTQREYDRSLAEYKDKTQTQNLLASLTGKQISGNINLFDMIQVLNSNYFKIFVECNYYKQYGTQFGEFSYIIQPNYDYSVDVPTNAYYRQNNAFNIYDFAKNVLLLTPNDSYATTSTSVANLVLMIFGYAPIDTGKTFQIDFSDKIGLNYNIVFRLKNFLLNGNSNYNINFTNVLNFPIRRKSKVLTYNNYGKWS